MKIGLIRCLKTEDKCCGAKCFKAINSKKMAFKDINEDIQIIGVSTCGGCSGKSIVKRARKMIKNGADTIVLASCITKVSSDGHFCPYAQQIQDEVKSKLGQKVNIIEYSH
ncbi:MAG: CGGC domain-containing protein [Acutalibacteraceae bacterium]